MASRMKKAKNGTISGTITKSTTGKIDLFQISLEDKDKFTKSKYHATFKDVEE